MLRILTLTFSSLFLLSASSQAACVSQGNDSYRCQSTGNPTADGRALFDFLTARQFACGSTILLDAGADYYTNDLDGLRPGLGEGFPLKPQDNCGDSYTTITSTRAEELAEGKRVTPADRTKMATLRTTASNAVLSLYGPGANRWRIMGVAISGSRIQSDNNYRAAILAMDHSFPRTRPGQEAVDIILDRVLIYPYEEELYGPISDTGNPLSWLRTASIAIDVNAKNFQLLNSAIYGFTGYNKQSAAITVTQVSQGNPALLTAPGISAILELNPAAQCAKADSVCSDGSGMRRSVITGATGAWSDLNGVVYLVYVSPDQVKVYRPTRLGGFYGSAGADPYNASGKPAWSGTAQAYATGLLTQYGFATLWGGPYKIINNLIETWGMGIFLGGADTPPYDPATVLSGSTPNTLQLSHVRGLRIGDLIVVDVPANSPPSTACTNPIWGCWFSGMIRTGKVTAIQNNQVTVISYGADGIDVAPIAGGLARWRGEVVHDIEIRRNWLYKDPTQRFADAGKGPIEVKQAINLLVDGNIIGPAVNGNYFVTTRNQGGSSPWMTTNNAVFSNNFASGPDGGIHRLTILGDDNNHSNIGSENVWFINNLHIGLRSLYEGNNPWIADFNGMRKAGGYAHNTHTVLPNQSSTALNHLGCDINSGWGMSRGVSVKDNIWGFGNGINTLPNGVECWPDKRTGVRSNIFIDTLGVGVSNILNTWPGNFAIPSEAGLFKGACTYETWENCELPPTSAYKGSASDGKDPGADIPQLKDRINGWSEDAGLLLFDTTIPGARNNPAGFQMSSGEGVIRFRIFNNISRCKVELYTNPARTNLHADTSQPDRQSCTRAGTSLNADEVAFLAGSATALSPATTYYYRITDGDRVMVGTFQTEPQQ